MDDGRWAMGMQPLDRVWVEFGAAKNAQNDAQSPLAGVAAVLASALGAAAAADLALNAGRARFVARAGLRPFEALPGAAADGA